MRRYKNVKLFEGGEDLDLEMREILERRRIEEEEANANQVFDTQSDSYISLTEGMNAPDDPDDDI